LKVSQTPRKNGGLAPMRPSGSASYGREATILENMRTSADENICGKLPAQDCVTALTGFVTALYKSGRLRRDLFRALKTSPNSQPQYHTHLVFNEVVSMGRQEATRQGSDEDCIHIGELPCYCHYADRLARLKQLPIFKVLVQPGRNSNHAEVRPTRHETSALTIRPRGSTFGGRMCPSSLGVKGVKI